MSYVYDALNRQSQVTDPADGVYTMDFDAAGRMTAIHYPDGNDSEFEYDNDGRVTQVTNDGPTLSPPQITYDYTYDNVGNFLSVQKTPGDIVPKTYAYDDLNRIVTDNSAGRSFVYDTGGNKTRENILGSSNYISFSYTNHKLMSKTGSSGSGIPSATYSYDNCGNRYQWQDPDDQTQARTISSFFPMGRLRQILEYPDSGSETSSETRYSYDEGEELFWEEIRRELSGDDNDGEAQGAGKNASESGSFAKGKSREDISVIDTSKTHSWTNQSKKPRTFARKVLGKKYEQHDQQVENWIHDQVEQDQAIDKKWYSPGSPRVIASAHAFCNSYYGYQGGALLFEKEISGGIYENNVVSSHSFIDYYIFLNGRKVGMYIRDDVDNGEEESYYYLYDGQGNVVEVANKVGDLPWYLYSYFTYGDTKQVESNEGEDDLLGLYKSYDEGPFGYKTGVRHYDPETGVFISPDPFKGYMGDPPSQHPYMYCHGNPIRYSDPSGYATTVGHWTDPYVNRTRSVPRMRVPSSAFFGSAAFSGPLYPLNVAAGVITLYYEFPENQETLAIADKQALVEVRLIFMGVQNFITSIHNRGFEDDDHGHKVSGVGDSRKEARNANKNRKPSNDSQNEQVNALVRDYKLTKKERRMLHDEITGWNYTFSEIEDCICRMFNRVRIRR